MSNTLRNAIEQFIETMQQELDEALRPHKKLKKLLGLEPKKQEASE